MTGDLWMLDIFTFIDRKILEYFIFCIYVIARNSLRKTDADMMIFCSIFSCIRNECGDL